MYLSKLEIFGFKSFANRVELAFDNGISAIVGPNGCGKTNIVDAIRWVLGEQRYSALRSEKMEDVIFNGTKTRKALGVAEASLVIENTKGILPSEYTQVTVGRRVYRSGESEYLLNKVPCRLKDILDLFMDTGMGADAYSVIELKMIEVILSDRTDERRRLFEEAAGVTKYKHRRKAAYRKLESVQGDLVRVNDIISEVQKAVNALERQAKKAEQHRDIHSRLQVLEVDLLEREYAQVLERSAPLEQRLKSLREDSSKIDVDLEQEESRLENLRSQLRESENSLAEGQREANQQREAIYRIEEQNAVAAEQVKALRSNVERFGREEDELRLEISRLEQERISLESRMSQLREGEASALAELTAGQAALAEFENGLASRKQAHQKLNDQTIALVEEIAERQSEEDRRKGRIEDLDARIERARAESESYGQEIGKLDERIAEMTAQDRQLRRQFSEAEVRTYEAEGRRKELADKAERAKDRAAAIRNEIAQGSSRVDFLKGLIESHEGIPEGVRYLAETDRWKPSRNLTVADVIHAEEEHRAALEAALGEFAGLIVVENAEEADRGIALLTQEQRGKATFVSLDRIPRIVSRVRLPKVPGIIGWAADFARYDRQYAPLFKYILDRILIVENAGVAAAVSARLAGVRCVTLAGEFRAAAGIMRGGSRRADEGGLIGKRQQIEDLQKKLKELQDALSKAEQEGRERLTEHDAIDLKALTDAVKGIEKEMHGVEMRIAQIAFEKKRAEEIIAKNEEEAKALLDETDNLQRQIAGDAPALEALRSRKADIERSVEMAMTELESLAREGSERSRLVSDLSVAAVTARGELQNAQNETKRRDDAADAAGADIEKRRLDALAAGQEIERVEASVIENARTLEHLRVVLTEIEERNRKSAENADRLREETHAIELTLKDRRRSHDDSLHTVHEHDLKLADLNARADHLRTRAREEFDLTLSQKSYPDEEFVDFAALREEIQMLREKIKSLGNINFAAFEEYTTEKTRLDFLVTQRNDLLEAEKTLLATIEEINTTAQKKFLDTFALIRSNFIETFKSLFDPGDECDLKLEEGVDPLEAQVEIVAKPRGKRPTSIDLLSGGEKTLTATALLFAIYLVKPSPFCILDEVDAPLDDANIDRFTRILRKFSDNTQFIVVTHNKRTMEAAGALYGVTMEEEGVSKLVTVRFNTGAQVQSAALASA
jgi:chromosome segregation protein